MVMREEGVRLTLEDAGFTTGMAKDTAAVALLRRELKELDGTSARATRSVGPLGNEIDAVGPKAGRSGAEIDKLSGRLRVITDLATIGAPILTGLGAAGVAGMISLTAEAGAAAGALGVTLLAVHGLGDGLKALDAYHLDPTTENLAKLNQQLEKLGPSGAAFVRYLDSIEPSLKSLQMTARDGLLPGAAEGIDDLLTRLPQLRMLIRRFSTEVGNLTVEGGEAIASDKLDAFLQYLHRDGIQILDDTAKTVGNLALAGLNLVAAFAPLETDFSGGLLDWSRDLEAASERLDDSAGLREFIAYVDDVGPKAVDTLGSIANAALQIVEATAPLGGPALETLGKVADVIASIADSDLGTPIFVGLGALALYNRTLALTASLSEKAAAGGISVTGSLARNAQAQYNGLRALPGMFREVTSAEVEMAAAERAADAARRGYLARLQMYNRQVAAGAFVGTPGVQAGSQGRVLDGLGQLELANRRVQNATEAAAAAETQRRSALRSSAGAMGKAAGLIGGLTLATSGLADSTEHANAMNLALLGSFAGPEGAGIGLAIGYVLDLKGAYDDLNDRIEHLHDLAGGTDQQALVDSIADNQKKLADLQKDANSTSLGEGLAKISALPFGAGTGGLIDLGDHVGDATGKTAELKQEIADAQAQLAGLRDGSIQTFNPVHSLAAAFEAAAGAAEKETQSIQDSIDAMRAKRSEALRSLDAELNYQAAIDDATQAIKDNGATSDKTTEKGRANRQALYALADGWNQQSDAAKNATGSLKTARQNFLDTAAAMKVPRDEAKRLADQLFEIPPKRKTEITADTSQAMNAVATLNAALSRIVSKTITITTRRVDAALGGFSFSSGGYTGAGGRLEPAGVVHRGEVVIPQDLVARDWAMLRARYGHLPGFADGGIAGSTHTSRGSYDAAFNVAGGAFFNVEGAANAAAQGLKGLKKQLDAQQKAYDKAKSNRDAVRDQEASIASDVSSGLRSDIFAAPAAFSAQQDPNSVLQADITRAEQFISLVRTLKQRGLTGPALIEILQRHDVALAQAYASMPASELQEYSSLFDQRDQLLTQAGQVSGNAALGGQEAALQRAFRDELHELREIKAAIKHHEAEDNKGHKKTADAALTMSGGGRMRSGTRRARKP